MTADALTALLHNHTERTINVDADTLANVTDKLVKYHYDEDEAGTQQINMTVRNGHIVYKGVELILSNKS